MELAEVGCYQNSLKTEDKGENLYSSLAESQQHTMKEKHEILQKTEDSFTVKRINILTTVSITFNMVFIAFFIALLFTSTNQFNRLSGLLQESEPNEEVVYTTQLPVQESSSNMSNVTSIDCDEIRKAGNITSGIYHIKLGSLDPLKVWCNMEGGMGWLVIQRRVDGSVDFYNEWKDYKTGFGNIANEFWLGLEAIHILTQRPTKLRVRLESWMGEWRSAVYSSFSVASESQNYKLNISGFSNSGLDDSFVLHNNLPFSTKDKDNDLADHNCARTFMGAWWYKSCHESNLNGIYYQGGDTTSFATGAVWKSWKGYYYSYKTVLMELSPL